MMKMLNSLREGTAQLHKRLEENNLANKIMDHSISLEEYKFLLYQNYLAYSSVEPKIAAFLPEQKLGKAENIKQDLYNLNVKLFEGAEVFDFSCQNEAEAIGAAYVLEGSAMGGLMIGKELQECEIASILPEQLFFSGKRESATGFNQFLKMLRNRNFSEKEIDLAVSKAVETFKLFEKAFSAVYSSY